MIKELSKMKAKPFLKWAGGKTQMLTDIESFIPTKFNKYVEPFIGAGALFFHLKPRNAVISDTNEELINCYRTIQTNPDGLIAELKNFVNSEEMFYKVRDWELDELSNELRAARMIFLNKTCFNGLYRVNKKGKFNTPFAGNKNPSIYNVELIYAVSDTLSHTTILHEDFETVLEKNVEEGDLVFLDPPYVPISANADFKRYTKDFFNNDDQLRLRNQFDRLVQLGAFPILTNSDAPFVMELYKDYQIEIIETRRSINSNSSKRTGRDVIVIGK